MFTEKLISFFRTSKSAITGDVHQAILDAAYEAWQKHDGDLEVKLTYEDGSTKTITCREYDKKRYEERDPNEPVPTAAKLQGESWGQGEMLDNCEKEFGKLARLCVQVGKYNHQVCNGGHIQYYDNGFATGGGGFGDNHRGDIGSHLEMVDDFEQLLLPLVDDDEMKYLLEQGLNVMSRFAIEIDDERETEVECETCGGSGMVYDVDNDGEEIEHSGHRCGDCCRGRVTVDNDDYGCVTNTEQLNALDTKWYEIYEEFMKAMEKFIRREASKIDNCVGVAAEAADAAKKIIEDTAPGQRLRYWRDFADVIDNADHNGLPEWDAAKEAYDAVIDDDLNGYGYLKPYSFSDGGTYERKEKRSHNDK